MSDDRIFDFDAGALCLDFANAGLGGPEELVAWGIQAGLISGDDVERSGASDVVSASTRNDLRNLSEAITAVCSAIAASRAPNSRDIRSLNEMLRKAMPNLELGLRGSGCCWQWDDASSPVQRILWHVVRSVADLVTSDDVGRLRQCAGDDCDWLFLDTSRGGRRKWCSMASCGNRAKARRHYARKQRGV